MCVCVCRYIYRERERERERDRSEQQWSAVQIGVWSINVKLKGFTSFSSTGNKSNRQQYNSTTVQQYNSTTVQQYNSTSRWRRGRVGGVVLVFYKFFKVVWDILFSRVNVLLSGGVYGCWCGCWCGCRCGRGWI